MSTNILNRFTAQDLIAIIESASKANVDQISIGDFHLKYKSNTLDNPYGLEASLPVINDNESETPLKDQQPSLDDGTLMITDPLKYEELQAMEG